MTALVLEEGKQIAGPVQYDKGAVSLGGYLKASLPNMSDLDGVEIIWRCVDKDGKNNVLIKGETGLSIKLDKPEYVGKYVYMIAVGKPEGKYYGAVFGKEILVEKAYNPSSPPEISTPLLSSVAPTRATAASFPISSTPSEIVYHLNHILFFQQHLHRRYNLYILVRYK